MSDLLVVVWADSQHLGGYYPVLRRQLAAQGLDLIYEPLVPFSWNRLVRAELDFCRRHPGRRIVGVDAEDFLLVGTREELEQTVPHDTILYHAEARVWPEPHLLDAYPQPTTSSPYRFVNGTTPCGSTDALAAAIEWGLANHPIRGDESSIFASNDQEFFTHAYLAGYGIVDIECRLSVQLNAVDPRTIRIVDRRLVLPTGVRPVFIHLNGASKHTYGPIIGGLL